MSKIKSILSITFYALYGAVYIQLIHFSDDDCENVYDLSYFHHQIGRVTVLPLYSDGL